MMEIHENEPFNSLTKSSNSILKPKFALRRKWNYLSWGITEWKNLKKFIICLVILCLFYFLSLLFLFLFSGKFKFFFNKRDPGKVSKLCCLSLVWIQHYFGSLRHTSNEERVVRLSRLVCRHFSFLRFFFLAKFFTFPPIFIFTQICTPSTTQERHKNSRKSKYFSDEVKLIVTLRMCFNFN